MIVHYKNNIKKPDKLWRKWLVKANYSITHNQNNRNIFDKKKILPIAPSNILSMLGRN